MRIYLVRHGHTELNLQNRIAGHVDTQLTDLGISQARDLGQWMRKQEISIDAIYASTLSRAYNTAQLIAESYDAMEVIGDDRLRERDAGPMAGAQKPLVAHRRELNGVESDQQLVTRFDEKMQEIYRQHSDQTVLAVAHGGVIPRRINHVCGTTYDRPGNTSISCVEYVLDEPSRCVRYGLMDHLC